MTLLEIQCKILESIDNREFSLGIFFDLSKAFDTVNHKILLEKLDHYGIRGISNVWFCEFLNNRSQYVYFKGQLSISKPINCGVPQGSILGPLLFLIYVNDIAATSKIFHYILFADDTNVFISDKSVESLFERANHELTTISSWFRANKLSLNIDKTKFILFRSRRKLLPAYNYRLTIDGQQIMQTESCKFLGVYLDQNLTWKEHITQISKKLAKNISILSRIRHCLSKNTLQSLYYSLIFPYLSYCNICWAANYTSYLKDLEILQKLQILQKNSNHFHVALVCQYQICF